MFKILLASLTMLMLISCAGKDITDNDTTPPEKPHMIEHLGDTGITHSNQGDTDNFFDQSGSENNGIDAYNNGLNSIRVSWDILTDTDIDYVEIWRFNLYEEDDTLRIYTMSENDRNYYVDNFDDYQINPIGKNWFYFIKVFDTSANFSVSDTVCYHLIDKPLINNPIGDTQLNDFNDVTFSWNPSSYTQFYLLIFDTDYHLLKSFSSLDDPLHPYEVNFSDLDISEDILNSTDMLLWQIVGDKGVEIKELNGKSYRVSLGSESKIYKIKRLK